MNRITEGQLKKIIAAILAVLLTLFGMLPIMNTSGATSDSVFAAESASGTEPNLSGSAKGEGSVDTSGRLTLIDNDFENNLDGIGLSGEGFEKRKSPNGTNALALDTDQNGDKRIGSVSQKPLPKGRYRISFDYYAEKLTGFNLYIHNENSTGLTYMQNWMFLRFNPQGNFEVQRTVGEWIADSRTFEKYETDKWYNIDIWIDTECRELLYKINGKTMVHQALYDGNLNEFKGFSLYTYLNNEKEDKYVYFDNFKFYKEDSSSFDELNPIYINWTANEPEGEMVVGNNFTNDKPASFDVTFKNRDTKPIDAEMFWRVLTYPDGDVAVTSENTPEKISLSPGETLTKTISPAKSRYGRLDLNIVTRINGQEYVKNIPYAMLNHSKDMPNNYACGVATHIESRKKGDKEKAVPLLKDAGIGSLRDEAPAWSAYEKEKGKYTWDESIERYFELIEQYDIRYMYLFTTGNGNVYKVPGIDALQYPPSTEEGYKEVENWMKFVIKKSNGRLHSIENWNEYHNSGMSGPFAKDDKVNVNIHKAIYKAIQDSGEDVLAVGIDEDGWGLYNTDGIRNYLKTMNGEKCYDVISLHPYGDGSKPEGPGNILKKFPDDVKKLLVEYKQDPDVPFYFSEVGYSDRHSTINDDRTKQAAYTTRMFAYTAGKKSAEVVFNYDLIEYPDLYYYAFEGGYGIIQNDKEPAAEVPYLAKPSYVSLAYYNNIVADNKSFEEMYPDDTDKFGYRIKMRDGSDVLMIGAENEDAQQFNFDLGCDSVTVGDMYGNERTVYGIDGKYSFAGAEDEIMYVRGNFKKVEECEPVFSLSKYDFSVPVDYNFNIDIRTPNDFKGKTDVVVQNVNIITDDNKINEANNISTDMSKGTTKLKFRSVDEIKDKAYIKLDIYDNDDRFYYTAKVAVNYTKSAQISDLKRWRMSGGRYDLWDLKFDITNIRDDVSISGSFDMNDSNKKFIMPDIAPGETREVVIPKNKIDSIADLGVFDADMNLSTGEKMEIREDNGLLTAQYAKTKPKIDGRIDKGEYGTEMLKFRIDNSAQVYGAPQKWEGADDLSADGYINYDDDSVYVAMKVKDNVFRQTKGVNEMWNGDSIQVLFVFDGTKTGTEYCISIPNGETTAKVYRHIQEDNNGGLGGETATGLFEYAEAAVKNEGGYTTYEVRFPFDKIRWHYDETIDKPEPGRTMWFSVCINDDDGQDRKLWMEYGRKGSAIGSGNKKGDYASELMFLPKQ